MESNQSIKCNRRLLKDQAKAEIDNVAQAKKAEIDRNSNATEEEKVAAKSKVDEAATTIKQAIDKAVNNSEVDNAIDVGKTAINNIEAIIQKNQKQLSTYRN